MKRTGQSGTAVEPAQAVAPEPSIRRAGPADVGALFEVRAGTRENALSGDRLAARGITPDRLAAALAQETVGSWVCEVDGRVVGFCNADAGSGEILVLAVRAGFEGRGIGRSLLAAAVAFLQAAGCTRPWLMAGADPALRSHGFYRANGWQPTGRVDAHGDEELVWLDGGTA